MDTKAQHPARALPDTEALAKRIKNLALRDTNVVVASVVISNLLRAVSSVILTRLLMPEMFGIAGIIASIQFSVAMASDMGFQAFVVRHADGDKPRFLDTVWTIALARSLLLTVVVVALAAPLAHMLDKPDLTPIIAVSALSFCIDGLSSLTLLTAIRRRMILRLSVLELIVMITQIVFTAALAFLWRSYWALLLGSLAGCILKVVLSYTMFEGSRRRLAWDDGYARELWSFARFVTGSSLIFLLVAQFDKVVLARVMPLDLFGLYVLAGTLASAPLAFASGYASRVLYPRYAELFREQCVDLKEAYYAKRRLPSLLYTFLTGGFIGSAGLIIDILYDERYAEAAVYLRILAIAPLFALASNSANEALIATGRISVTLQASVVKLIWLVFACPTLYAIEGPLGIVLAVGLMEVPALLLKWVRMHHVSLLDLRQELLFVAAGGAGILCGFAGEWAVDALLSRLPR